MRSLVLVIALAACTEPHDGNVMQIQNTDCSTCHAGNLVHPETKFPLTTMMSPHSNAQCFDCHRFARGPGLLGFHADCTGLCHLQNQRSNYGPCATATSLDGSAGCESIEPFHTNPSNVMNLPYAWDATNHDFCTMCHSKGLFI